MIKQITIGLFALGFAVQSVGCSPPRELSRDSNRNSTADANWSYEAQEIANARPDVSIAMLKADEEVLEEALPVITHRFRERGFTEQEALEATLASWRELRVNQLGSTEGMSTVALGTYATQVGKLTITSTPEEADIEIGGQRYDKRTNTTVFLSPGTYRRKVTKSGYDSVEKTCTVREGERTYITFELKPSFTR